MEAVSGEVEGKGTVSEGVTTWWLSVERRRSSVEILMGPNSSLCIGVCSAAEEENERLASRTGRAMSDEWRWRGFGDPPGPPSSQRTGATSELNLFGLRGVGLGEDDCRPSPPLFGTCMPAPAALSSSSTTLKTSIALSDMRRSP